MLLAVLFRFIICIVFQIHIKHTVVDQGDLHLLRRIVKLLYAHPALLRNVFNSVLLRVVRFPELSWHVKVEQSLYRPRQALRVPEVLRPPDFNRVGTWNW